MRYAQRTGRAALLMAAWLGLGASLQAQQPAERPPVITVALTDGSVLIGRLVAQDSLAVTLRSELLGEFVIPRTAIAGGLEAPAAVQAAAADAAHAPSAPEASWSRTVRLGMNYASVQVPGSVGATKGAQVSFNATRTAQVLTVALTLDAAYQHTDPDAIAIDESSLALNVNRTLGHIFSLRSISMIEHNGVEELDYRFSESLGVGWKLFDLPKLSLQVTPGVAYVDEHGDRLDAISRAKFKNAKGAADALYQTMSIRPMESVSIDEEFQAFHAFDGLPGLQYTGVVRLVGMMSRHVGMTLEYKREFDSTLPYPIIQTIERVSAGIQVGF